MAAINETTTDQNFEDMKNLAIEQQQCFYELLSDCMTYKPNEHKYLKQNIGYALYGPPNTGEDATNSNPNSTDVQETSRVRPEDDLGTFLHPQDVLRMSLGDLVLSGNVVCNVVCNTENQSEDADVTDAIVYKKEAQANIDKIYNKIRKYTIGANSDKPIYFAIIYNIIVCPESKKSKKSKISKKSKKEKGETKKEDETEEEKKKKGFVAIPIPIFKIWKSTEKKTDTTKKEEEAKNLIKTNEIWYIDTSGRVYKNWADYQTKNNLFKCTMVLPKEGLYQADPSYPATEDYSTVWLEIMDSPACSLEAKIYNGVDIASTISGTGALAIGVATLVTPVAPVVLIAGGIATGASALWGVARSTQQLVDRSTHEESVNPLDREAFPQWLTITGSAFGLGAMGGTAAISAAVSRGMTVNTAARLAFNTVQGGNLFLNGVGIIYQGYCMVDRYRTDETFSFLDAASLATHLMFFAGAVVNIQFAGDIIENNQGRILDDYRESLRTKRLRKQFNRVKRRAAANNSCSITEKAEVICYINSRNELISNVSATPATSGFNKRTDNIKPSMITWTIENGILIVNDIELLDARRFVAELIRLGMSADSNQSNMSSSQSHENDFRTAQLWSIVENLLEKYFMITKSPRRNINTNEFIPLFREMDSLNVNENLLKKLFNIAIRLIQRCRTPEEFLFKALKFIWLYCKTNLKQWGIKTCLRMQSIAGFNILYIIITALFEAEALDNLYVAFEKYLKGFRSNTN